MWDVIRWLKKRIQLRGVYVLLRYKVKLTGCNLGEQEASYEATQFPSYYSRDYTGIISFFSYPEGEYKKGLTLRPMWFVGEGFFLFFFFFFFLKDGWRD